MPGGKSRVEQEKMDVKRSAMSGITQGDYSKYEKAISEGYLSKKDMRSIPKSAAGSTSQPYIAKLVGRATFSELASTLPKAESKEERDIILAEMSDQIKRAKDKSPKELMSMIDLATKAGIVDKAKK
jgi:hypothetical protein